MEACVFCDILSGRLPSSTVYQDHLCTAFMDIQPINAGHLLVIPNQHAAYLADLEEKTGAHMFKVAQRMAAALRKSSVRCEGINLFLADGEAAMQEVFHVHLHVIPRYKGDGFRMTFSPAYYVETPRDELDQVAQMIKQYL
jgi:histidine triad (HIT) family protein